MMTDTDRTRIPLSALKPGQTGVVRQIAGGHGLLNRLAAMGLMPGMEIRVVRSIGPMLVEVRANRLVLGRGLVGHILVEPSHPSRSVPNGAAAEAKAS
jgi:ferrous iron transport protein A